MERIHLRKEENALLYAMRGGMKSKPQDTPAEEWNAACYLLEKKGLIRRNMSGGYPEVELTEKGSCYLFYNPKLKNPRRWREEGIVLAALLLLMAAATLLLLTI